MQPQAITQKLEKAQNNLKLSKALPPLSYLVTILQRRCVSEGSLISWELAGWLIMPVTPLHGSEISQHSLNANFINMQKTVSVVALRKSESGDTAAEQRQN